MARTKKQLREKFSKKIALHTHLLKTSKTVNRDVATTQDLHIDNVQHEADAAFTHFLDLQSMTLNFTWPQTKSAFVYSPELHAVLLRRAVVLVEDISKSPDKVVASMVKKQLSRGSPGSKSPARTCHSPEQRDGSAQKKSSASDDRGGDGTPSPSTGNKNIFEQFSLGRKSPRRGGSSPRSRLSGSTTNSDGSGTRSGSEEKQHESIATAVRALRGLSGKVVDGQSSQSAKREGMGGNCGTRSRKSSPRNSAAGGHSRPTSPCHRNDGTHSRNSSPVRKDNRTLSRNISPVYKDSGGGHSRNASPGSSSPRGHSNSASPKRHSPRTVLEKMSPPGAISMQKCLKVRKSASASAAGSDCSESPTPGKRVRSPRRASESLVSPLGSPHSSSSHSYDNQLDKCVAKGSAEGKGERSCFKGDEPAAEGEKTLSSGIPQEHNIHILSSTSRGSRIIQLDTRLSPGSAARRLFVETEPENFNSSLKQNHQFSPLKNNVKKQTTGFSEQTASSEETIQPASDETESLLCAMLVGGSEVTKIYEQSRDHNSSAQMIRKSSSNPEQLCEHFPPNSRDSFFDDDPADDFSEPKPYELPVLSHLPPLPQPNFDVLDLVECSSDSDLSSSIQHPVSHRKKTTSLLALISRVKDCLPSTDKACQDAVTSAEEVLQDQNIQEDVKNTDASHLSVGRDPSKRNNSNNCAPERAEPETDKTSENIAQCEKYSLSNNVAEGAVSDGSVQKPSACSVASVSCADSIPEDKGTMQAFVVDMNDKGAAAIAADDALPGSPGSLGELDTAMMTQAASLVVRRHVSSPLSSHSADNTEVVGAASATPDIHQQDVQNVVENSRKLAQGQLHCDAKTYFSSSSPVASWQSFSGAVGATQSHIEQPSLSKLSSNSKSSFRSFFNRIASPSKMRWKPKVEPTSSTGRPSWSKWHKIASPLPIEILNRHEKEDTSSRIKKASAFSSKHLDLYLRQASNRIVIPACRDSRLAKFLVAEGYIRDYEELQRHISEGTADGAIMNKSVQGEEGAGVKSEEEEDIDEDERDYEISKKLDPDFDEVGGLVFVSFPSEMGVKAHTNVESCLQWETDPLAYINMAKFHAFEESRRHDGKIRRQSQGLRGQHMKWRKYQRLYRKELRRLIEQNNRPGDLPCPLSSFKTVPEKTADVNKIKNWKYKFGSEVKTEDLMALELLGEEEEERVKRKRKTYVFSSKKKKPKRPDTNSRPSTPKTNSKPNTAKVISRSYPAKVIKEEKVVEEEEEHEKEVENDLENDLDIHEEISEEEEEEEEEDEEEEEEEEGGDNYGTPIPIDQDDYMSDVRSSIEELRLKEKGLRHSKGIFARFKMGPEDRHIFKKLGGWVTRFRRFRRMPPEMKLDGDGRLPRKRKSRKGRGRPSFELQAVSAGLAMWALRTLQVPGGDLGYSTYAEGGMGLLKGEQLGSALTVSTDSFSNIAAASLEVAEEGVEMVDLTSEETITTPEQKVEKRHCDKPGCRYGCICHLCLPSTESDETDPAATSASVKRACDKEYCRLGCICDSLEKSGSRSSLDSSSTPQPGKLLSPSNIVPSASIGGKGGKEESDMHQLTSIKQETPIANTGDKPSPNEHAESSGDELPTLEKTAPRRQRAVDRYSNLPRRQTSYRMAKNLDAVSRKAMMMWETSEVYSEQTNRRKKTPESALPPAVTSSPCVTPISPVMSSSSTPSSTPTTTTSTTTTTTTPVLHGGGSVTAGVSVNTLPALMTTLPLSMVAMPPPPVTPNGHNTGHSTQETSPVVVSDDEGKSDDTSSNPKFESKRSRMKKRLFSTECEENVAAKKTKTSNISSTAPVTTTTSSTARPIPPAPTPETPNPPQPRWHSSLICLKASNPANFGGNATTAPNNNNDSDDVMEEDEIKLFEFISNCPWEKSKAKILAAITNTLKRGVYPEPRVMQIDGHRVEILPKAHRPSTIPMELRAKLPKSMYSVRVKVTEIVKSPPQPQTGVLSPPTSPTLVQAPIPLSVGQRTVVIPATPTSYAVSSIQGVLTILPTLCTTTATMASKVVLSTASSASSCVTSPTSTTSATSGGGNLGISGLGRLQISHAKLPGPDAVGSWPHGRSVQHFKIQKESLEASSTAASSGGTGDPPVEKKKKKKKKKRKNLDPGDDSLVPDLSNLTVSPRRSSLSSSSSGGGVLPSVATTSSSLTNFKAPGIVITSSSSAALRPTSSTLISQPVPLRPLMSKVSASSICPPVRPQLLGLSNLPANLSGVKFLQLPGQNSLLQIVPASALGLKPMDNKNVPNFVAVPVSLTSVAALPTGLAAGGGGGSGKNKSGSRVQIDIPSKVFAQTQQQNLAQPVSACGVAGGGDQSKGTAAGHDSKVSGNVETSVTSEGGKTTKKKRKKKSKKSLDISSLSKDQGIKPSVVSSSSMLVAPSPAPIMSSATLYPVQMVLNTHASAGENKSGMQHEQAHPPRHAGKTPAGEATGEMKMGETIVMLPAPSTNESTCANSGDSMSVPAVSYNETNSGPGWGKGDNKSTLLAPKMSVNNIPTRQLPSDAAHGEGSQAGGLMADDDSQGSGFDSLYLSSDSEVDDDGEASVGSPVTSSTVHVVRKKRDFTLYRSRKDHKDSEQRRRNMLQEGYKELTKVLNVSNNLPKALPKAQILSKTVKLIQYHSKVLPRLVVILEKARTQHCQLQQQLHKLMQRKLREGVRMDTIQVVLDQVAAAYVSQQPVATPTPHAPAITSGGDGNSVQSNFPFSLPGKGSTSNNIHSITEVGVGNKKSRFVIEIDRGDEDDPFCEDVGRESSEEFGSFCSLSASFQGHGMESSHEILQSGQANACSNAPVKRNSATVAMNHTIAPSKCAANCDTAKTVVSCITTDEITSRNQAIVSDTTCECVSPGRSNLALQQQNSGAVVLSLGQAASSGDLLDETGSAQTDGECVLYHPGEGTNVHAIDNDRLDGSNENLAAHDDDMNGMGLVITSVTSLQDNTVSLEAGDVAEVIDSDDENTSEKS